MRVRQVNRVSSNRLPFQNVKVINGWWDTIKTPSSTYAQTYWDLPIDQDDWGCGTWQVYFQRNEDIAGIVKAREWINIDVDKLNPFADLGACKYDCDFVAWLQKKGLPYNSFITNIYCGITEISETGYKIAKTTNWIWPVVIVGGLAVVFQDDIRKAFK